MAESKRNIYGVWFNEYNHFTDDNFAFNWLGAPVKFKLLGKEVEGTVRMTDNTNHHLTVEFLDGRKAVEVAGHFNCFRKF